MNVAAIEPDGTVMLLGALADELMPIKLTTLPPGGAAVLKDTPSVIVYTYGVPSLGESPDFHLAEWQARRKKNVKFDG